MHREFIVFVLFLAVNISLSVNCFIFPFSMTLGSVARDVSWENEKKDNPFPQSKQIKTFPKITNISLISKNPIIFQFTVDSKTNICLKLKENIHEYEIKHLSHCDIVTNQSKEEIKWLKLDSKTQTFISNRLVEYEKLLINPKDPNHFIFFNSNEDVIDSYFVDELKQSFDFSERYTAKQKEFEEFKNLQTLFQSEFKLNSLIQIKSTSLKEPKIHLVFFERESEVVFKDFILTWDKGEEVSNFHWNILFWRAIQIASFYADILINKAIFFP